MVGNSIRQIAKFYFKGIFYLFFAYLTLSSLVFLSIDFWHFLGIFRYAVLDDFFRLLDILILSFSQKSFFFLVQMVSAQSLLAPHH